MADIYQEGQLRQRLLTVMNARSDEVDVFMTLPSREGEQFLELKADPHEERNFWSAAATASERRSLQDEIWRIESQIRSRGWMAGYR